ncbi:hypothetical protein EKH57_15445 [Halorubrum sp. BOL3-1]|uniref:8-oxoguanine DNA glycosylase OGG fold protein n=1 Tax=Halorubrum sp. BOL3-1 TaxID=2497325 RepID=UPI00100518E5|nr:hypothetical protein [Halorubrum sp. BOL3-1]QAU13989.1 hypothetical protein EKH57_15445 [Halorubrum sp. BOL3-1]
MDLTPAVVETAREEYPDRQPLSAVETEHLELLPAAFESGDFGWRDAEWVVQWYYRRFLGEVSDDRRRAAEDAYAENDAEAVRDAIAAAAAAEDAAEGLERLTALSGVGVAVGSAFLQFLDPEAYVVVGRREWRTLRAAGELDAAYPDPPTTREYEQYLETCRRVAERCGCSLVDLYCALWVLGADRTAE